MLIIFPSLIQLHKSIQADDEKYQKCKNSFKCGNLNIGYPFYDEVNRPEYCGFPGFKLDCNNDMPEISMNSTQKLYLLDYKGISHTISVAREDYWDSLCPEQEADTSINLTLYSYTSMNENFTLCYVDMAENTLRHYQFRCPTAVGYFQPLPDICSRQDGMADRTVVVPVYQEGIVHRTVFVPVYQTAAASITNETSLQQALRSGFELEWLQRMICVISALNRVGDVGMI